MDKAIIPAIVAIALWVLTRWFEIWTQWRTTRRERRNLIRSLFTEVDFNTKDLAFFLENSANMSAIEAHLRKNQSFLPHITDAHHTIIYSSNVNKLHHVSNRLSAELVLFYGLLEKIKVQIDGINLPSYASVSAGGKIAVIRRILANVEECEEIGRRILRQFTDTYPKYELVRHDRKLVSTKLG